MNRQTSRLAFDVKSAAVKRARASSVSPLTRFRTELLILAAISVDFIRQYLKAMTEKLCWGVKWAFRSHSQKLFWFSDWMGSQVTSSVELKLSTDEESVNERHSESWGSVVLTMQEGAFVICTQYIQLLYTLCIRDFEASRCKLEESKLWEFRKIYWNFKGCSFL